MCRYCRGDIGSAELICLEVASSPPKRTCLRLCRLSESGATADATATMLLLLRSSSIIVMRAQLRKQES